MDCAYKEAKTSSFVVIQVWARSGSRFYLVDQTRRQMGLADTIEAIKAQKRAHPKVFLVEVEDKANGSAVVEALQRDMSLGIDVRPVNPGGGKTSRAQAVSPLFRAGLVHFPDPEIRPWANELQAEILSFPKGRHDDQCDALSMSLRRFVGLVQSFVPIEERPLTPGQERAKIVDDWDKQEAERRKQEQLYEDPIYRVSSWGAPW